MKLLTLFQDTLAVTALRIGHARPLQKAVVVAAAGLVLAGVPHEANAQEAVADPSTSKHQVVKDQVARVVGGLAGSLVGAQIGRGVEDAPIRWALTGLGAFIGQHVAAEAVKSTASTTPAVSEPKGESASHKQASTPQTISPAAATNGPSFDADAFFSRPMKRTDGRALDVRSEASIKSAVQQTAVARAMFEQELIDLQASGGDNAGRLISARQAEREFFAALHKTMAQVDAASKQGADVGEVNAAMAVLAAPVRAQRSQVWEWDSASWHIEQRLRSRGVASGDLASYAQIATAQSKRSVERAKP